MRKVSILLITFLTSINLMAQSERQEDVAFRKAIFEIDTNDVKQGMHLEVAKIFSIEDFVVYYLENGNIERTKMGDLVIRELYTDSAFTYFGRLNYCCLRNFFKVKTDELAVLNLNNLDGNEVRELFISQIIPLADKERAKRRESYCSGLNYNSEFSYQYLKSSNEVVISYKWLVSCSLLYRVVNERYNATYDISKGKFSESQN